MSIESKRQNWLKSLKSDTIEKSPEILKLEEKIRKHIKEKGSIDWVQGAFGDTFKNLGYVEDYPITEKGVQTKFYGCSFTLKGKLNSEIIDTGATVKRVLMEDIYLALPYKFSLIIRFFFSWRKLLRRLVFRFTSIYEADLIKKTYKSVSEFSPFPRELVKAGVKLAEKIPLEYPLNKWKRKENREYRTKVEEVFFFIGTVVQQDFAYTIRTQDPLSNLNKQKLNENPRKEILRLIDLAISRENHIMVKLGKIRKLTSILLLLPIVRKLAKEYFNELDLNNIKPDKDDLSFSYRREGYNTNGLTLKERMSIINKLDKENGNVIIR